MLETNNKIEIINPSLGDETPKGWPFNDPDTMQEYNEYLNARGNEFYNFANDIEDENPIAKTVQKPIKIAV